MRPREVTNDRAGIFLNHLALFVVMWGCICYRDGRVKKEKRIRLGGGVWDAE